MSKRVLPLHHLQTIARKVYASSNAAEIAELLSSTLSFYDVINFQFGYDDTLWRGVKCDSDNGYSNIHRVGCPPPEISQHGRLNEAGYPVLYTSTNHFTVLEEIGVQDGDFVHLIGYAFKSGATLHACMVGEITHVHRSGRALTNECLGKELIKIMSGMTSDVGRSFVFTDSFFSSILRDLNASANNYLRSRILARLLFRKIETLEAIMYPSVVREGAMNLAIVPHAANVKLTMKRTLVIHVKKKYDYGIYELEVVRKAKSHHDDGTIEWQ